MAEITNNVRRNAVKSDLIDDFDRRILGALVENSGASYAELGKQVGLSAPAVHQRVKILRRRGAIKGVSARLDAAAIGKPLLTFVHVDFAGWGKSRKLMEIANYPEVEEMHSVAGDAGMILKVRTEDAHALELLLSQLYSLSGVKTTRSYITLSTFLERPVQAEVTKEWPALMMMDD